MSGRVMLSAAQRAELAGALYRLASVFTATGLRIEREPAPLEVELLGLLEQVEALGATAGQIALSLEVWS